ncbi:MAG: protein arginine kinase [Candidatus Gygaella obscura]|nr:protein arginine kinase [Candidatus Gygaella obscura]
MKVNDLLNHTSEWLKGTGPNSDIVISSRVRLARNIENKPFPHWANKKESQEFLDEVAKVYKDVHFLKSSTFIRLNEVDNLDKQFLIERHLMSHEHALLSDTKALLVDPQEVLSIMINEEDHMRIQVMQSGFNLKGAFDIIDNIDNGLSSKFKFAFTNEWGYLTACPTNTGTGMRGSVMLHLSGLVMMQQINRVLQTINKLGITTRGLYGEGTKAYGNFFQISNQYTLGRNEQEIVDNINGVIQQVIEQEQIARQTILKQHNLMLQDRVWRSLGILKNAFLITSQETIEHLSVARLGIELGIIKNVDRNTINELFILTQPAHLQKIENRKLTHAERDQKRADLVRQKLTNN